MEPRREYIIIIVLVIVIINDDVFLFKMDGSAVIAELAERSPITLRNSSSPSS